MPEADIAAWAARAAEATCIALHWAEVWTGPHGSGVVPQAP